MNLKEARRRLIEHLGREIQNRRVLEVMGSVPREEFLPEASRHLAYEDIPLPIGEGQTISQPYIVALMTQALELSGVEKVLEVGTGSGYQSAILSLLASRVITVERYISLADRARERLSRLGYKNIEVFLAGEGLGWKTEAPYEAIVVTAGAPKIPQELLDQLVVNGRLVIPVGSRYEQDLVKVTRLSDGLSIRNLGACRFVPLVGDTAWREEEV